MMTRTESARSALIDFATGCGLLLVSAGLGTITGFTPILMDIALWVSAAFSLGLSLVAFVMGANDLRKSIRNT